MRHHVRLEIGEYQSQRDSLQAELSLAQEKLTTNQDLLRDALVTQVELLESEREVEQLEGQIATISLSIPRARAALTEANQRIEETRLQFRREVQVELCRSHGPKNRWRKRPASRNGPRSPVPSPA